MTTITLTVNHASGLHARPAAKFVQTAVTFPCAITVKNMQGGKSANAKSILSVLTLGVNQGTEIEIEASGEKDVEALEALKSLVETNFGEEH
ncbi:MAG: HPr family phosphocarrier protein [Anaerolineaceae bacterium]|nr:HPr family phosphocarrier protein [Anaerolineaceae bacterium]